MTIREIPLLRDVEATRVRLANIAVILDALRGDAELPSAARRADLDALRGLPAVGRGVGGAIRGTQPGSAAHLDALAKGRRTR